MADPSTNGHALPTAVKPDLQALRDQLEYARLRRELLQEQLHGDALERQRARSPKTQEQWTPLAQAKLKRMVEEAVANSGGRLQEDWFDRFTPFTGVGMDADGWHRPGALIDFTWSRKGGKAWPYLVTEIDLDRYREYSRTLVRENSHAKGLLKNYCHYVAGPGPTLKLSIKDSVPEAGRAAAEAIMREGQAYLEGWTRRSRLRWRTRQVLWRMKQDGEALLRHYVYRNELVLRWVEPVYLRNPPNGTEADGWNLGVQSRVYDDGSEDVETIVAYHIVAPAMLSKHQAGESGQAKWPTPVEEPNRTSTGEIVPAHRITHVKNLDEPDTVKRGLPEFYGETAGNLVRAAELLRATMEGSTERALIAIVNQWQNATHDNVMAFHPDDGVDDGDPCDRHYLRGGKRGPVEVNVPKGHEYKDPPRSTGPSTDIETVQAGLRGSCAPLSAPEYWTGDASNNNYASTKEAGSPIMRASETEQEYLSEVVQGLGEKALRVRMKARLLPANLLDVCELQVEMPKLLVRDRKETIDEEIALTQAGLESRQTAQMNLQLNPDREKANMERERAEQPPATGPAGEPLPPGAGGQPQPGNGPQPPKPVPPARVQEAAEHDVSGESRDEDGKWTAGGAGKFEKQAATRGIMASAQRVGKGKEAKIVMADGKAAPGHIKASMVPPDWSNVQVSTDPDADVLVTARDKAGRVKTVYSDSFHMKNAAVKFARVHELLSKFSEIQGEIQHDRRDPARKEMADCAWLMSEQATRPGSDTDNKAKVKAYGATTLRTEHVEVSKEGVRLHFIGKEGVEHNHLIRDPDLAKMLVERKQTAGKRDGKLFDTSDTKVRDYVANLDGGGFLSKDLRTARANLIAQRAIDTTAPPRTEKEYKAKVKAVAEAAAHVLGNRPQQCLESYINPALFAAWRAGLQAEAPKQKKAA